VNDLCSAALPLVCGTRVTGTTIGSTATGDPFTACDTPVDQGGVFYAFTGTGGVITVSTCDTLTSFDTKLFVYRGACGGPYTCVAGNDDTNTPSCNLPATVVFPSVNGVSYWFFVSGYGSENGPFGLTATCAAPTGLPTAAAQRSFQVWPNPVGAAGALHVTLTTAAAAATATWYTMLGQRVAAHAFHGIGTDLSTADLRPGTYWLAVQVADQVPAVQRVVVE
jgi:hypothetical protein